MLAGTERLPSAQRDRVLAEIPHATLQQLTEGIGLGWVTGEEYHALVNALVVTLQPESFRNLFTAIYLQLAELPVLSAITHTALRMGLGTPEGLARYAPPTWGHLSENMGQLELVTQPTAACIRCTGYPTQLGPPDLFVHAFAGTFDGFYQQCERAGRVEVTDVDVATGSATFRL